MDLQKDLRAAGAEAGQAYRHQAGVLFLITIWFGLVAGWLELGLILTQRGLIPHVSQGMLRTNRHYVWMIPVSDVLLFLVVGLAIALLGRFWPRFAWWTARRLPVALSFLILTLAVEGLYPIAGAILACGLAARIGPWLERWNVGFKRFVRMSVPALAVGVALLTALNYERVTSAERRALDSRPPAKSGAPNVVLIVLDTVRAANLSLYGHTCPTTPNLEQLARKGIVFSQARSTAPWTLPSHASMLTGRWPHELSVGPDRPLDTTFPTVAEVLARQGYATAGFVGNVFYCSSQYGIGRGFARYQAAYENHTVSLFEIVWSSVLGRRLIEALGYPIHPDQGWIWVRRTAGMLNRDVPSWLDQRRSGEPFFVFINYYDAHRPYVIDWDPDLRFGMAASPTTIQQKIDKAFMSLAAGNPVPPGADPFQIVADGYKLYHDSYDSCIAYLDRQVGLLVNEIDRRGLLENSLVIVTSDHGEQFGEHGLIAHGASVYRPETHVPLIVIPPRRSSMPQFVSEPVSIREIPATIAEFVGLGSRSPFPGRSLMRYRVAGAERAVPTKASSVLCELQHNLLNPAVRPPSSFVPVCSLVSRDHVYIRTATGREELYDLIRDPFETNDLAQYLESRPILDQFRSELSRVGAETPLVR